MDKDLKRWKFLERWGEVQTLVGIVMFVIPMFIKDTSIFLFSLMLGGLILAISGMFISGIFGSKFHHKLWNQNYVHCSHCGNGWIRKEK